MDTSLLSLLSAFSDGPDFYFYKARHVPFFGPIPLHGWRPPHASGIYAIVEPLGTAGQFRVIYVGKANTFADRGFPQRHEHYADWIRIAGYPSRLYVVYHFLSSEMERVALERDLIERLCPPCNKQHNALGHALQTLLSQPARPFRSAPLLRFP